MPEQKQEDPGAALKAQSMKEFEERTQGKPTPTQEENDRAKMGEHVTEKEPDGSKEEPPFGAPHEAHEPRGQRGRSDQSQQNRQSEPIHTTGGGPGGYQTRQSQPSSGSASRSPASGSKSE